MRRYRLYNYFINRRKLNPLIFESMKIIQMLLFLLIPLSLRAQEDWTKRLDKTTLYDLMKDAEEYNWIEIKEVKDYYTKMAIQSF